MRGYEKYIQDVESGKIVTGNLIKCAVRRFREFEAREDIYFDKKCVDAGIEFISLIKHYLGKHAGEPFVLSPWEAFIFAYIFGFKWKDSGLRVVRSVYIEMARKQGKSAFTAAISLYMLLVDGEASPEIVLCANSREQAKIILAITQNFSKSLDRNGKVLKQYRQEIDCKANNGFIKIISSDASKGDGMNISFFCEDEFHEAKDRRLYDVLASSQGMRTQPLAMTITTAGYNLDGPCYDMHTLGVEILNGVKQDDKQAFFIFNLDPEDDWQDPDVWIKANPNLGVTVTKEFIAGEIKKAVNDSTAEVGVKTKTLCQWVQSKLTWIPREIIAKQMAPVDLQDYAGQFCIIGVDLSTVSDFSSISVFLPPVDGGPYVFKSYTFLPEETIREHPNKILYEKFIQEGTMIVTDGNVINYDFIAAKINEISQICPVSAIYYDKYNATQWAITMTDLGYNLIPFGQGVSNYNGCTKEFERLAREGSLLIDKSSNVLWQFGNVFLKVDSQGNAKPSKESYSKKIDSVISMTTALGGWMHEGGVSDMEIFCLD